MEQQKQETKIDWIAVVELVVWMVFNPVSLITIGILIGCYQAAIQGN